MRVSQQVLEWQAEIQRANLLRLLEKHCKTPVPSDLAELIRATQDMNLLSRWYEAALDTHTFEDFRAAAQLSR